MSEELITAGQALDAMKVGDVVKSHLGIEHRLIEKGLWECKPRSQETWFPASQEDMRLFPDCQYTLKPKPVTYAEALEEYINIIGPGNIPLLCGVTLDNHFLHLERNTDDRDRLVLVEPQTEKPRPLTQADKDSTEWHIVHGLGHRLACTPHTR